MWPLKEMILIMKLKYLRAHLHKHFWFSLVFKHTLTLHKSEHIVSVQVNENNVKYSNLTEW